MFCRSFASEEPWTPYAPTWNFKVGTAESINVDLNSLTKYLLQKEKEVKKLPSSFGNNKHADGYTGLGKNSSTAKFRNYNIITWDNIEIQKIKQNIIKNLKLYNTECGNTTPNEVWIQAWFNVMRFGQRITPHMHSTHPYSYLTGHFNVQVGDTSTVYMSPINQLNNPDVISIKNIPGDMTIFPSYIFHYTTPHYSFTPRITIAFDINLTRLHRNFVRLI